VIIEDKEDELDSHLEATAVSALDDADPSTDVAPTLPKPNGEREAWFDVEADCWVYEDIQPTLLLKQVAFTSSATREPVLPLGEHSSSGLEVLDLTEHDDVSVEEEMHMDFKELSASVLGSPPPQHDHDPEPPLQKIDHEPDHRAGDCGSEKLGNGPQHHIQDQPAVEGVRVPQGQEIGADMIREGAGDEPERTEEEKRHYRNRKEAGSDTRQSDDSCYANVSRSPKRRRISLVTRSPSATTISEDRGSRPPVSVTDLDREWEIRDIAGRKTVDGERHYLVGWEPTWMPESELEGDR
jgi:hypothetical protein